MCNQSCKIIYIYIYMSRDPHTPPQPDGSPPCGRGGGVFSAAKPIVAGRNGFLVKIIWSTKTIHTGFTHIFISLYIQIYIHNYICLWSPEDSAGKVMHLIRKIYSSVQGVCQQCPYCVSSTGEYT